MREHIFVYNIAFIIKVNDMNVKFIKKNGWKEETEIAWMMFKGAITRIRWT